MIEEQCAKNMSRYKYIAAFLWRIFPEKSNLACTAMFLFFLFNILGLNLNCLSFQTKRGVTEKGHVEEKHWSQGDGSPCLCGFNLHLYKMFFSCFSLTVSLLYWR